MLPGGLRAQFAGCSAQNVAAYLVENKKHVRKRLEGGFQIGRCLVMFDSLLRDGDWAQFAGYGAQNVEVYLVVNKKQVKKTPGDGVQTWRSAVAYYSMASIVYLGYSPEKYLTDTA